MPKLMPKPFGQYGTWEDASKDYQQTDQFLSMPAEKRGLLLDKAKDRWTMEHAKTADAAGFDNKDVVGKAHDIISKILDYGKGPGGNANPLNWPLSLTQSMLPNDAVQAAIDASMFAVGPEALAGKAAYRILKPAVAGGLAGAIEEHPISGAAQGAAEAIGGEALTGVAKGGAYFARKFKQPSLDFTRLAGWLEQRLGKKIPDMQAFRKLFVSGDIVSQTEAAYNKIEAKVARKLGSQKLVVPGAAQGSRADIPFQEAVDHMHTIEKQGWDLRHKPAMTQVGADARDAAHSLEGDIAEQLDQHDKGLATEWYTAHGRLKEAKALRNLFNQDGALDENGPNFSVLQQLVDTDHPSAMKYDLIQSMGEDGQKSLRKVVMRGAPEGSVYDRPGQYPFSGRAMVSPYGVHMYGGVRMPYPTRHVGKIAFDMGKGRALRAVATIGPYSLLQNLTEMSGQPQPQNK